MENIQNKSEINTENNELIYEPKYTKPINPHNAFDNPTENPDYNDDYGKIVPQISIEGCKIPHLPSKAEKKRIRYFYNIAGGGILFHLVISVTLANILSFAVMGVLMGINGISLSDVISGEASENFRIHEQIFYNVRNYSLMLPGN